MLLLSSDCVYHFFLTASDLSLVIYVSLHMRKEFHKTPWCESLLRSCIALLIHLSIYKWMIIDINKISPLYWWYRLFCITGDEVCYDYGKELMSYDQAMVNVLYDVGSCNFDSGRKVKGFDDHNFVVSVTNNFCCSKQGRNLEFYQCSR